MKTGSEKSSSTRSRTGHQSFFAKTGGEGFFSPGASTPFIQAKMEVNKPGDKFEQEADGMAEKVMRMPAPAASTAEDRLQRNADERLQKTEEDKLQKTEEDKLQKSEEDKLQKSEEDKLQKKDDERLQKADAPEEKLQKQDDDKLRREPAIEDRLQRDGAGAPGVSSSAQSAIQGKTGGGQPLSSDVRGFMEPRFNADFGKVRVHHDTESASLNNELSARAFTYHNHIFFSRGQYQPGTSEGRQLLAHELTHTIQQGHAVQRRPRVSTTAATPAVQRFLGINVHLPGLQTALNWIADKANIIPGYRLLTILMGFNPINGKSVDTSAANMLRAAIELIPGVGPVITRVLDAYGLTSKVAAWFERKMAVFGNIVGRIGAAWDKFKGTIGAGDIVHPIRAWERAKAIFTGPIGQFKAFIGGTVSEILKMVKDAILKPLAALAKRGMPNAYDLLVGLLGKDPITGDAVHPSAEMLIGGFLKLIHQDEIFENMKRAHAIPRAVAWFHHAVAGVKAIALSIPGRVVAALNALTFPDVVTVVGAFAKIGGCFLGIAGDFLRFAGSAMWDLLEIIFDVLAPGTLAYIKRTGAALRGILRNPMPFMRNLVAAAKLGLNNFKNHFWTHLKKGLLSWLTGSLDGVYIPKALTLVEMGKFALSVLGISWAHIRAKIVKALGPRGEQIMQGLEKTFDVIKTLVTGGPAAIWALIKQKLSDLKDKVIHGIISFVTETIVEKAIPKLVAMFIPGAGFISAIITIYDTIMTIKRELSRIWAVVTGFLNSIVAIASGHITSAANRVEGILANLISLAINFLAGLLGLGKVTDKINGVLQKLRAPVDKALDVGIEWIVGRARALFARLFRGHGQADNRTEQEKTRDKLAALAEAEALVPAEGIDNAAIRRRLRRIKSRYKLSTLELVIDSSTEAEEVVYFTATASPGSSSKKKQSKLKHHSNYVTYQGGKFVLKPSYRAGTTIRTLFYEDTSSSRQAIVDKKLGGRKTPDGTRFRSQGDPQAEKKQGYPIDPTSGRALIPIGDASPDHDPPIAQHWTDRKTQGNNLRQTARVNWDRRLRTYKLMSWRLNRALGSRGWRYTNKVGRNFRGPGDPR